MQHVNPRAAGFIEAAAPETVAPVWEALTDSVVAQPCSSGLEGNLYCTLAWNLGSGRCNLVALDGATGARQWEDRLDDGSCLLDEFAWITNPLVDTDGHLYVADSRQIASFTSTGDLRWVSDAPALIDSDKPNNPFGLSLLPDGRLVTATMGDGVVLVVDRATGNVDTSLDLPSAKQRTESAAFGPPMPDGFMDTLAGPDVGPVLFDVGTGVSDYEVDNNVAVDPNSGLVFITGGAPAPNPDNDGALWAIRLGENDSLQVAFSVIFDGPGGIATTPTITKDGKFVLIGDNQSNIVAVDIPGCAALSPGSVCTNFASEPVGEKVGASFTARPDNVVYFPLPQGGLRAYRVENDSAGDVRMTEIFNRPFPGFVISSVMTGFDNVLYLGLTSLAGVVVDGVLVPTVSDDIPATAATRGHFLVAVGLDDGVIRSIHPSGDFANVTMLADGETLITNNINFVDELRRDHHEAGVRAWRAAPGCGDLTDTLLNNAGSEPCGSDDDGDPDDGASSVPTPPGSSGKEVLERSTVSGTTPQVLAATGSNERAPSVAGLLAVLGVLCMAIRSAARCRSSGTRTREVSVDPFIG